MTPEHRAAIEKFIDPLDDETLREMVEIALDKTLGITPAGKKFIRDIKNPRNSMIVMHFVYEAFNKGKTERSQVPVPVAADFDLD